MSFQRIIKETTPEAYKRQIAGLVAERKQNSEQQFSSVRRRLPILYDMYRGWVSGKFSPHKNDIHIPMIFSVIQSDVARKTQTSFGSWPAVSFLGYAPEDAPIARKREALINAQMKDCGTFLKGYDLFLTSDLYGTTFIQYGWRHDEDDVMVSYMDTMPLSGEPMSIAEKRRVVMFDGPDWKVLNSLDTFPQPAIRNVSDMDYFIVREYMDLDKIRQKAVPDANGRTLFDSAEVRRMEQEGTGAEEAGEDYRTYRQTGRSEDDMNARTREKYARPVELWTMYGRIPSELAPSDGITNRIVTVANGKYVLRNRPNPLWSGKIPIIACSPSYDPHHLFAPGKAEMLYKMNIIANRFTNQQLDALDLYIDPVMMHNEDAMIDTDNLFMRPGKWIKMQGTPSEMVQPLVPNLTGVQMGGQMTEMLWRWGQQGSGIIEDTVMGGGAGNRTTAREYLGRSEAVATRLLLESRLFEENVLEPMADAFVDLNRQFLTEPREVFILGSKATVDEITGLPIPQRTRDLITGWDLAPNYEARAVGATTRLGRAERINALTFLIQALGQNPMAASATNWITFLRHVFKAFELDNVNEIIQQPSEQEKMMVLMQGKQQPAEVPGQPNSAGSPGGMMNFVGQGVR